MSKKAFTMASNRYCGDCGSFDLVISYPGWIQHALGGQLDNYCYGCGNHCSEKDFLKNALRTLPLTVDDFFFQTNLRDRYLKEKQIQPMTLVLSVALIVGIITGLFLYESSSELEGTDRPMLEWVNVTQEILANHEAVAASLRAELDQLVKAK